MTTLLKALSKSAGLSDAPTARAVPRNRAYSALALSAVKGFGFGLGGMASTIPHEASCGHLPVSRSIGEPLALDAGQRAVGPLKIINAQGDSGGKRSVREGG